MDSQQASNIALWKRVAAENQGLRILNASGGLLDCFPRIRMDDLPAIARGERPEDNWPRDDLNPQTGKESADD